MIRRNTRIRKALEDNGYPVWVLGIILGCSDSTVTRMMRKELPEDDQNKIIALIRKAKKEELK